MEKGYPSNASYQPRAGGKQGGKGGFVPHSERECYKWVGKGHIALNCPTPASEVSSGQGGAERQSELPFGQPAGLYSVEACNHVMDIGEVLVDNDSTEGQKDRLEWRKQREETRRINRFDQRSVTKAFHHCGANYTHNEANAHSEVPKVKTTNEKTEVQRIRHELVSEVC